ncbi:MAG: class I SAM-dependent rRNA methyltransferase [Treponema sp.]|jgi:23S rRNA (cytosine1962-C5)-methyltransferase|nr:class I SAM-dependent rRNA methyltransferase [Treponema sp.]
MSVFPRIFLKPKEEIEIRQGFPWVFDNEIASVSFGGGNPLSLADCVVPDGWAVEVFSVAGLFLGTGIINRKSKITVRLLTPGRGEILFDSPENIHTDRGSQFFRERIKQAHEARFLFYGKNDSYRLIFAEADFIPGLTVDRYCTRENHVYLVVQFLSLSCEVFRKEILAALWEVCCPRGIYERSDVSVRALEGLEKKSGWIGAVFEPVIIIRENSVLLKIDLAEGQKTGYFLDQKNNRRLAAALAGKRRVLDAFTHTGAFGLNAALGGASSVIAADISEGAVRMTEENITLNKAGGVMKAVCADVFDLLRSYEATKTEFDMIILDPPAFAKKAGSSDNAFGGYKEINLRAMKLLAPGGILVTCSCSSFFDAALFYSMIVHAARDAKRRVQILEKHGAGPDHPVLAGYSQSEYLKCAVLRVV